jgi:D-threo-aldose 1-dehydrogenase
VPGTVRLGETGVETTALGFGCAQLFRLPRRARLRLLETALDAGIRHFDVAPMYGLGLAEGELGRFARGRRDRIVIATKFGIEPALGAHLLAPVQGPLQRLRGSRPATLDARTGLVGALLYRSGRYDAATARSSLERSLRALGTDYVDLLFLHDPLPGDVRSDDVRAFLETARAAGRIRAWGAAGEPEPIAEAAVRLGGLPVRQVRSDVFRRAPRDERQPTILFGAIGRALPQIVARLEADGQARRRWSDAAGVDCGQPEELARLLLRDALRENPGGAVLFATTRRERIVSAAEAEGTGADLEAFRRLVQAELAA